MGMDLYPAQDGIETYHANWTSWGMLGDLLTELGCDLSAMSGSNDGHEVDARTAQAWGDAVLTNLGRIHVSVYADDGFSSGERLEFHVEGTTTPVEVSSHLAAMEITRRMLQMSGVQDGLPVARVDAAPLQVVALAERPEELAWVIEFGQFCRDSGGFEQW